jgi:hypothetical protein
MPDFKKIEGNINKIFDSKNIDEDYQKGIVAALDILASGSREQLLEFMMAAQSSFTAPNLDNLVTQKMADGAFALLKYMKNPDNAPKGMLEVVIFDAITQYTTGDKTIFNYLKNVPGIKSSEEKDDGSAIITLDSGKTIHFSLLSQFLDDFATIEPEDKKELESSERVGKCHSGSPLISQILLKELHKNSDVVSGRINFLDGKASIVQSWVEANLSSRGPSIIDYTMNVIMDKDGYEFLNHPEELNRVSGTTIKDDSISGLYKKIIGLGFADKEYLLFRDEIVKYVKKLEERNFEF